MSSQNPNQTATEREVALQAEIDALEASLGGRDPQKIINEHIKLLHEYNEIKDVGQALLGKLATLKQTTVKQLHEDYGLEADD